MDNFTENDLRLWTIIATIWNDYETKFDRNEVTSADLFDALTGGLEGEELSQTLVHRLYEYARNGTDLEEWLIATQWNKYPAYDKYNTITFNPCVDPKLHPMPIADFFQLQPRDQKDFLSIPSWVEFIRIQQSGYDAATDAQKALINSIIDDIRKATGKGFHEIVFGE